MPNTLARIPQRSARLRAPSNGPQPMGLTKKKDQGLDANSTFDGSLRYLSGATVSLMINNEALNG